MAVIPRLAQVSAEADITPQKRVPELIRVPADRAIKAIILSESLFRLPTHYDGAHTVICAGELGCDLCAHRALRVYYLVAVLDTHSGVISWCQLSELAAKSMLRQCREAERGLYGTIFTIGRERPKKQAPITVALDRYATVNSRVPKAMEPSETLERVFNSPKLNGKHRREPV